LDPFDYFFQKNTGEKNRYD
jgi:hypothetical protein